MAHTFNCRQRQVDMSLRLAWATKQVPEQDYVEPVSKTHKENKKKVTSK